VTKTSDKPPVLRRFLRKTAEVGLRDPKRREEIHLQGFAMVAYGLPVAFVAAVLAGLYLNSREPTKPATSLSGRDPGVTAPVGPSLTVPVKREDPIEIGTEPYRLLGRRLEEEDIQQLFAKLGKSSPFSPPERQSRGLCFRNGGVDMVFDDSGLEKLICYAGHPDEHSHQPSSLHPFGIQFDQPRAAIRAFVAVKLGAGSTRAALLGGDCDTWDFVSPDFQFSYQLAIDYQGEYPEKITLVRKDTPRPSSPLGG
jgi:hypothetical protein